MRGLHFFVLHGIQRLLRLHAVRPQLLFNTHTLLLNTHHKNNNNKTVVSSAAAPPRRMLLAANATATGNETAAGANETAALVIAKVCELVCLF
jgi:uncharacterized membrane protein